MSKRKKQQINRVGLLRSRGWNVDHSDKNTVRPHTGRETVRHWQVKCAICRLLSEANHTFFTEVQHKTRGACDVLDCNIQGNGAYIYEVETNCSRDKHIEKVNQYTDNQNADEIIDVFVIDPTEAPSELDSLESWVSEKVVV